MVVQVSDGSSGRHSREHTSNTITPTRVGSSLDADAVLDGSGNEWWLKYDLIALCMTITYTTVMTLYRIIISYHRLMSLLDNGIDLTKLYHVCQELSSREITPPQYMTAQRGRHSGCDDADAHYASRVLSKSCPPSPRDGKLRVLRCVLVMVKCCV